MNLFIDTHLNDVVIILYKDGKIIKQKKLSNEKEQSKIIMPTVKKILNKKVPESIIVVNGPGSFTGVRLGVTIAKTFAYTLNIPIRTISSLECLGVSLDSPEKIVSLSDNNGYYVGVFDENCNLYGTYEYLSNEQYKEYSDKYAVFDNIKVDYNKVIEFALKKEALNPHEVKPLYVKKLDVEK